MPTRTQLEQEIFDLRHQIEDQASYYLNAKREEERYSYLVEATHGYAYFRQVAESWRIKRQEHYVNMRRLGDQLTALWNQQRERDNERT